MAKTFVITLPDELERALSSQAQRSNQSPEETMLELLEERLMVEARSQDTAPQPDTDPLLAMIGSITVDIPDLAENHDYYIGQALLRELNGDE